MSCFALGSARSPFAHGGCITTRGSGGVTIVSVTYPLADVALEQSKTTHGAAEAMQFCAVKTDMPADAIEGQPLGKVLHRPVGRYPDKVQGFCPGAGG